MATKASKETLDDKTGPPPYFGAAYMDQAQNAPLISRPYHTDATFIAIDTRNPNSPMVTYDNCHLVWSIISFFLCNICGVVAIVMSILGYVDYRTGNYANYRRKRCCAIGFLVTGLILGTCVISAYVVCKIMHGEEGGFAHMTSSWRSTNHVGHDEDVH